MNRKIRNGMLVLVILAVTASCTPVSDTSDSSTTTADTEQERALARVGAFAIYASDVDHHVKERYAGRSDEETRGKALDELVDRARLAQAALDVGLDRDPEVRAEIARILSNRMKERTLKPILQSPGEPLSDSRLREIYAAQSERFSSPEKRRIAVLWLNPGADPNREGVYREKLEQARDWFLNESELNEHPEQGFSVLAVDHSEHAASRFKGGEVGWMEREGGTSEWARAVADIAFSLRAVGEVSEVVSRPEGIFLVRLMAIQPAVLRSFESVREELEREERTRTRQQLEAKFHQEMVRQYPLL